MSANCNRGWIIRSGDSDEVRTNYLYPELTEGRLRMGCGGEGMALKDRDGFITTKRQWEENYRRAWRENPSPKRYSVLLRLLKIEQGDVVVMPKMPNSREFSIARVSGGYQFGPTLTMEYGPDYGHIIPVDPASVRTFNCRANRDAYAVSRRFSSRLHRSPVTFISEEGSIEAARNLLEMESIHSEGDPSSLDQALLDDALKKAAEAMLKESHSWGGLCFEKIVKQAFKNRGYEIVTGKYPRYDGSGSDVDIVVRPPSNIDKLFMPQTIAVQVKWKKGIDEDDTSAVEQLARWDECDPVEKIVISSADGFTEQCKRMARDEDIMLLGGLNTMYFLMGLPNPFREEDEEEI